MNLSLAEEAFFDLRRDAIERQLIDTFVGGLTNLKMTIMSESPKPLEHAVGNATNEHNLRARVHLLSLNHVSQKEIVHYRNLKYFKCKQTGHTAKCCRIVNAVNAHRQTDRKIRFWGCCQEGHVLKLCKQKENDLNLR